MSAPKTSLDALKIDRSAAPSASSGTRIWPIFLLLLLLLGGAALWWWQSRPQLIEVTVVPVREVSHGAGSASSRTGRAALNASGYVKARRAATVSSKVTAKVMEVLVEEGLKVQKDQILATLDESNARESLLLAEAQLTSATRATEETKPNLIFARQEMKRFSELVASKAASQSDFNRAEAQVKVLEATLSKQEADITVAERQVAIAKQQLDDNVIRAPFAGVITTKDAQPGEMISPVSAGGGFTRTGICTIVDMESLEIDVDVNESYINRVSVNQPVEAKLDAYPEWIIPAKVIAIIPTADRQKATVKVRVGFEKLDPKILPDMGIKVAFQTVEEPIPPSTKDQPNTPRSQLIIPATAVRQEQDKSVVWIVIRDKAERRVVTLAPGASIDAGVLAGLTAQDRVIVRASRTLTSGARVKEVSP